MKELKNTDYVIYDNAEDRLLTFENGLVIIYGNKEEAKSDLRSTSEEVISCTDLPKKFKNSLLKQINLN